MTEPRSGAQSLTPGAGGKEYTVNDIVSRLAALTVGSATAQQVAPPGVLVDGDVYIVGAGATGIWAGQDDKIAHYRIATGWDFITPQDGYKLSLKALGGKDIYWNGLSWIAVGSSQPRVSAFAATTTALSLAIENLPFVVDHPNLQMTWNPTTNEIEVATDGVLSIAYRFQFQGTASASGGTADIHVKRNAVLFYLIDDLVLPPTISTTSVTQGSVQLAVTNGDVVSFEIGNYSNITSLDLIGGKSWLQGVI
jgi:hypothetical protein